MKWVTMTLVLALAAANVWAQDVNTQHNVDDWSGDEVWIVSVDFSDTTDFRIFQVFYQHWKNSDGPDRVLNVLVTGRYSNVEISVKDGDESPEDGGMGRLEYDLIGNREATIASVVADAPMQDILTNPDSTVLLRLGTDFGMGMSYETVELPDEFHREMRKIRGN